MKHNLFSWKVLTFAIIFLFLETFIIPNIAQDVEKSYHQTSRGNWLYVGGSGPGNYSTIQDAIDNASNGDTIFVFNGTYVGYVIINKSINLIGEDKNTTFIIGFFAYTVSIVTDWVNMSGFTIQNGGRIGEGVRIDSNYNNFINNIIDIPNDRIRLSGDDNTISYNIVKNTYLYLCGDSNIITNNTITNNYYGLYSTDCYDNIISNNSFFNSGLFISDVTVWNNIVTDNTVNGKPLVYLDDESDMIIDIDAGQITLVNCTYITVKNQELLKTSVGIQILGSNNCIISDNTIVGNYYGIYQNSWNITINNNTITNNYFGIYLFGDNNTIISNVIANNIYDGIYVSYGNQNDIISNIIINNYYGILLDYGSDFNDIINNTISNNSYAVTSFSGNSNTIISGNIISNNNYDGIHLIGDKNTIYANTITNNKEGITLGFGYYNNIINNMIANNSDNGIYISDSYFNNIINNNISSNDNGIYVLRYDYNIIAGNNINWNNWSGIYMNFSNNNNITGNSILKNIKGIYLISSTNNTILKNNFLRNKQHALFENCTNTWNRNYWDRSRILPKLIFGIKIIQNNRKIPILNIDWRPAKEPYYVSDLS